MDRLEWMIEKSVEIGVSEISFVLTQNCERRVLKLDRLMKKVISAMKQSTRFTLPKINEIDSLNNALSGTNNLFKVVAHLDENSEKLTYKKIEGKNDIAILIGPEGGFTKDEG